jgi:molybdenum cofactor cytidylyltransferase
MTNRMEAGSIAAVVLAAGDATRFGGNKLLHPFRGTTVLEAALQAPLAAGLTPVVVVTGAYHTALAPVLERYPVQVCYNPNWSDGMATSLRAGLLELGDEVRAAFICQGDMPLLPPEVLRAMAERYRTTGAPMVAPFVGSERRNPVLFDRRLWPELLELSGDEGARSVVRRYSSEMERVEFTEPAWFADVDEPGDAAALEGPGPTG